MSKHEMIFDNTTVEDFQLEGITLPTTASMAQFRNTFFDFVLIEAFLDAGVNPDDFAFYTIEDLADIVQATGATVEEFYVANQGMELTEFDENRITEEFTKTDLIMDMIDTEFRLMIERVFLLALDRIADEITVQ